MYSAKTQAFLFLAVTFLFGSVSPGLAASPLSFIHEQAWRLDAELGTPAPGQEQEFEKNRKNFAGFIEVFQVAKKADTLTVYFFQAEDGFFITSITAALSKDDDGWFALTGPKVSPDAENVWYYKLQDQDTMLYRRASGTYVYKRLPDFTPPRDPFTHLNPLPWK